MIDKNKRKRIGDTVIDLKEKTTVEEVIQKVEKVKEEPAEDNWLDDNGEFMWEAYEGTCITRNRKVNPHIKTNNGDKVYSREPYAQALYDKMYELESNKTFIPSVNNGEILEGIIYGVSSDYITVEVGYRQLVYVKYEKEPIEIQALKPGDETAVLITQDDSGSLITGSIHGGVKHKVFMDLRDGVETGNTAWVGVVKNMIENGGYIVNVQGIDCFMPGSLAGINKLSDFSSIIEKELYVVPVSFSPERGTLVVSHRKYLQALIPNALNEVRENMDVEKTGKVTGTAKYGIFVEFDQCLTGMIHNNDLDSDTSVLFKKREIKPGDSISFKVKDIVSDTKITLTQKTNVEVSPWLDITTRYQIPSVVEAVVKSKKDYGLFINIEEGITGLLHISEIGSDTMSLFNNGDKITVQINRIDVDSMKVFLKMPE
jgi:small subunit ribosomal protein S1